MPNDLASRFNAIPGRFWRGYGELAKGVGSGTDTVSFSSLAEDQGSPDERHVWFMPDYTSGSDYGGQLVERSNYEVLYEEAEKLSEEHGSDWFQCLHGGHGSYGILFHVIRTPDAIIEMLAGLEDYPLLDEEKHSEMEFEAEDEAWSNWGRSEYKSALEKAFNGDADEVTMDVIDEHFAHARDAANVYWVNESGDSMYIDIARIVKHLQSHDGEPPEGFVYNEE